MRVGTTRTRLTRHETRLMNTLHRILLELDESKAQRVEGEIVDDDVTE